MLVPEIFPVNAKLSDYSQFTTNFAKALDKYFSNEIWYKNYKTYCEEKFIKAPASPYMKYHGAWEEGLLQHSALIYALCINAASSQQMYTEEIDMFFCKMALLHDLGKIGTKEEKYYLPEESEWHRNKLGKMFEINPKINMLHEDLSIWWCNYLGVNLSPEEYDTVRYHDLFAVAKNNLPVGRTYNPLYWIFCFADNLACKYYKV